MTRNQSVRTRWFGLCLVSGILICGVPAFAQIPPPGLFRLPAPAGPSVGPFVPSWTRSAEYVDMIELWGEGEPVPLAKLSQLLPNQDDETVENTFSSYLVEGSIYLVDGSIRFPDQGDTRDAALRIDANDLTGTTPTPGFLTHGDTDYFLIPVTESSKLHVWTSGDIDTVGVLENAAGKPLTSNDDQSDSNWNFQIVQDVLPADYYLRVTPYDADAVGFYQLNFKLEP